MRVEVGSYIKTVEVNFGGGGSFESQGRFGGKSIT